MKRNYLFILNYFVVIILLPYFTAIVFTENSWASVEGLSKDLFHHTVKFALLS